jgi:hypothetical protein
VHAKSRTVIPGLAGVHELDPGGGACLVGGAGSVACAGGAGSAWAGGAGASSPGEVGSVICSPCSLISFSNAVSDSLYLEYALLIDICCNGSVVVKDALWKC